MYASMRQYTVGAGSIDSLMHRVDEEFAPAISQEPGFVGYFMLEVGDADVQTISIFHDRSAAEDSNQLAAAYVRDNLGEFELTRKSVTSGHVLISRATAEALDEMHRWGRARVRAA